MGNNLLLFLASGLMVRVAAQNVCAALGSGYVAGVHDTRFQMQAFGEFELLRTTQGTVRVLELGCTSSDEAVLSGESDEANSASNGNNCHRGFSVADGANVDTFQFANEENQLLWYHNGKLQPEGSTSPTMTILATSDNGFKISFALQEFVGIIRFRPGAASLLLDIGTATVGGLCGILAYTDDLVADIEETRVTSGTHFAVQKQSFLVEYVNPANFDTSGSGPGFNFSRSLGAVVPSGAGLTGSGAGCSGTYGFLNTVCEAATQNQDTAMNGHARVARDMQFDACNRLCTVPSIVDYEDNSVVPIASCRCPDTISKALFIDDVDTFVKNHYVVENAGYTTAFVRVPLAGTYTFQRGDTGQVNELAIACEGSKLDGSAGSNMTVLSTRIGWPEVELAASVSLGSATNGQMARYYWNIKEAPPGSAQQGVPPFLESTLTPRFVPDVPGIYIFEFAAYDGCQIAWSTVQVNATCLGCTIDVADAAPVVVNDFDQSLHGWTPAVIRSRAPTGQEHSGLRGGAQYTLGRAVRSIQPFDVQPTQLKRLFHTASPPLPPNSTIITIPKSLLVEGEWIWSENGALMPQTPAAMEHMNAMMSLVRSDQDGVAAAPADWVTPARLAGAWNDPQFWTVNGTIPSADFYMAVVIIPPGVMNFTHPVMEEGRGDLTWTNTSNCRDASANWPPGQAITLPDLCFNSSTGTIINGTITRQNRTEQWPTVLPVANLTLQYQTLTENRGSEAMLYIGDTEYSFIDFLYKFDVIASFNASCSESGVPQRWDQLTPLGSASVFTICAEGEPILRLADSCQDNTFISDWNAGRYSTVTVDASYSYSPAGLTLGFDWELTATPKDSLLPLGPLATTTNTLQFQPDSNGTFTLTVRATDGCRKSEITTFKVDTMCTQPEPAQEPTVTPVGPFVFDNSTFSYGYPTAQITLDTKGYTFQSVVWELTLAALPSNAKQAAMPSPVFVQNGGPTASLRNVRWPGVYTVKATARTECGYTHSASGNVEFRLAAPNDISVKASSHPTFVTFDFASLSWPTATVNATGTTPLNPSFGGNLVYNWTVISTSGAVREVAAVDMSDTFLQQREAQETNVRWNANDGSWNVFGNGILTMQATFYDQETTSVSNTVQVHALCPVNPGQIDVTTPSNELFAGSTIAMTWQNAVELQFATPQWTLTSIPRGSKTTQVSSGVKFGDATFVPDVSGDYVITVTQDFSNVDPALPCTQLLRSFGTITRSITIKVVCEVSPDWTPPKATNKTVTFTKAGWPRVVVNDDGADRKKLPSSDFDYRWSFVAAPVGSVYAPSESMEHTNATVEFSTRVFPRPDLGQGVVLVENGSMTVETSTQEIRFVSLEAQGRRQGCFWPDMPGTYTIELLMIDCAAKAVQLTIEAVCPAAPELLHEVPASAHMIAGERHHTIPLNASKSYSQSHMPLQLTWTVLRYFNSSQLPDTVPAGTQVVGDDLPEANLVVYSPGTYLLGVSITDGCSVREAITNVTVTADIPSKRTTSFTFQYSSAPGSLPTQAFRVLDGSDELPTNDIRPQSLRQHNTSLGPDVSSGTASACVVNDPLLQWKLLEFSTTAVELPSGSELSAGAIAGIVIGSLVGVALAAGCCFVLGRRRKNAPPAASAGAGAGVGAGVGGNDGYAAMDDHQYPAQAYQAPSVPAASSGSGPRFSARGQQ